MRQETLAAQTGFEKYGRKTRRERFLEEMEQVGIFRHELRGKFFSVAAVRDDRQFGTRWWAHRQWSKTCSDEWQRLLWWSLSRAGSEQNRLPSAAIAALRR
jgi:hypothetical protein